jgi:hypothetical protein
VKNDRPELTQGQTPACPGPGRGGVWSTKRGGIQKKNVEFENFVKVTLARSTN